MMTPVYQFKYSKTKGGFFVFLACFFIAIISIVVCVYLKIPDFAAFAIFVVIILSTFRLLKKYTFGYCTAKINDTQIEFDFGDHIRTISYNELISFNAYYGQQATSLTLKNTSDNFRIISNNFNDRESFNSFCKDLVDYLDTYKEKFQPEIIHVGSPYATKGMFYFVLIVTTAYLLSFIIESKKVMPFIGIGGGIFVFLMWTKYIQNKDENRK